MKGDEGQKYCWAILRMQVLRAKVFFNWSLLYMFLDHVACFWAKV